MNPPFERGIDAEHFRHGFSFLKPGGRLIAVVSSTTGSRLESWVLDRDGEVIPLLEKSFKSSFRPTAINTSLLYADCTDS